MKKEACVNIVSLAAAMIVGVLSGLALSAVEYFTSYECIGARMLAVCMAENGEYAIELRRMHAGDLVQLEVVVHSGSVRVVMTNEAGAVQHTAGGWFLIPADGRYMLTFSGQAAFRVRVANWRRGSKKAERGCGLPPPEWGSRMTLSSPN